MDTCSDGGPWSLDLLRVTTHRSSDSWQGDGEFQWPAARSSISVGCWQFVTSGVTNCLSRPAVQTRAERRVCWPSRDHLTSPTAITN